VIIIDLEKKIKSQIMSGIYFLPARRLLGIVQEMNNDVMLDGFEVMIPNVNDTGKSLDRAEKALIVSRMYTKMIDTITVNKKIIIHLQIMWCQLSHDLKRFHYDMSIHYDDSSPMRDYDHQLINDYFAWQLFNLIGHDVIDKILPKRSFNHLMRDEFNYSIRANHCMLLT